ncbi:MAG: S8 family serine peptidase [Candidatus Magasanikbacteria bacterium]|nr:S8 family serine peptidase [Candidatus Magasanikbacteria bacterium]
MRKQGFVLFFCLLAARFFGYAESAQAKMSDDPYVYQWAYEDAGVYSAWDISTGSKDVVVAVIDNGFDTFHPDLRDNVWKNDDEIPDNGVDDDANGYIDDVWGWNFVQEDFNGDGLVDAGEIKGNKEPRPTVSMLSSEEKKEGIFNHGTIVAGIIGARGDNGKDGAGLNWNVRLMNIKVIDNTGVGSLLSLPEAIYYAVDNGANIINVSMVGTYEEPDLRKAVLYAHAKGVLMIAAAGNDSRDLNTLPYYPICSDSTESEELVLGVSAIDKERRIAQFSNYGSQCIDITAPGVSLGSTIRYSPKNGLNQRYSTDWQGTSFAAPFISGTAALIKSVQPSWTPDQIYDAILKTVHHTPGQDEAIYAHLFGSGLVQVGKAVQYALDQGTEDLSDGKIETVPVEKTQVLEKIVSLRKDLMVFDPKTGKVVLQDIATGNLNSFVRLGLVDSDDFVSYQVSNQERRNVIARKKNQDARELTIYDQRWHVLYRWEVPSQGPLRVAVGDLLGSDEVEIILYPATSEQSIFSVYSISGELIAEKKEISKHHGVSLSLIDNAYEDFGAQGKKHIVVLYQYEGVPLLEEYRVSETQYDIQQSIELPAYALGGTVVAGDIDGDGRAEYIVGSGPDQDPTLSYYYRDGSLKRKFTAYDPVYRAGIQASVLDYDNDGSDDVLVSALDGSQPLRVWDRRSRKLADWWPFGQNLLIPYRIIPLF